MLLRQDSRLDLKNKEWFLAIDSSLLLDLIAFAAE